MKRGEGDFFLSLSLNDFVLTVLFLILLLTFGALLRLRNEATECREDRVSCDPRAAAAFEQVVSRLETLTAKSGADFDEVKRLVLVAADEVRKENEKSTAADTLKERVRQLEQELAALAAPTLVDGKQMSTADVVDALQDAQRGYQACASRMRQCGLGMPPCWMDSAGKAQYIFRIVIHANSVAVERAWPPEREKDAEEVPGALALPGEYASLEEFGSKAQPVRAWSQQQNPECRHYVHISTDSETVEKKKLLAIEHYFYKYLQP